MTKGRSNPSGGNRKWRIDALRNRDGDNCCHCGNAIDFDIADNERPDFPTLEHHPVPWRTCRSHDLTFLKLSHRYCNERADLESRACLASLRNFERNWQRRQGEHVTRMLEAGAKCCETAMSRAFAKAASA